MSIRQLGLWLGGSSMGSKTQPPWSQPEWLPQITTWIESELSNKGIEVTGVIEQPHVRPWSTVLTVPTSTGILYAKAPAPIVAYEAPLTQLLAQIQPEIILSIMAVNEKQGWFIQDNGGNRLREVVRGNGSVQPWQVILPQYARLQIESASRVAEILALGVPDRRIEKMPAFYTTLIADSKTNYDITEAEYGQLLALQEEVERKCRQLAAYNIPATIQHGDLHDANIFYNNNKPTFFDWGDSAISHPFFSIRTAFVSIENSLNYAENDSRFIPLRDPYLEPWTQFETKENLVAAFELAQKIWSLGTAMAWYRLLSSLDDALFAKYSFAIPSLLRELIDANESALK